LNPENVLKEKVVRYVVFMVTDCWYEHIKVCSILMRKCILKL